MGSYRLRAKSSAAKELQNLALRERRRVIGRVQALSSQPRPPGSEKLAGQERYRLRQGNYRILYEIDDAERSVVIFKIGHRRDVYR
ncbi:MAG: type II toxin-antitoxin system RelE/ParE family toxin [Chloroflexi bacterium]|nr:type II toxin-antitoxin system RelE/ParE family toxin [Chloroflexota bacterium]